MTKQRTMYKESDLAKKVEAMEVGTYYVAPNVYLSITPSGAVNWKTRFRLNGKAIERVLAPFGENNPYVMDYSQAVTKSIDIQKHLRLKQNPLEISHAFITTTNELVKAFIESTTYKYEKELDIYENKIKPVLGEKLIVDVTSKDLEDVIRSIVDSDRVTIAAKAVGFFKNIFNYASTHRLVLKNVAAHLTKQAHAGYDGGYRKVYLKPSKIKKVFEVFQEYPKQASFVNQCAIALYLIFGFRKTELLQAKWSDFDADEQELTIYPTKKGKDELTVIIPDSVMFLFKALRREAGDSPYIFPSKGGAASGHMSVSTLNAMIRKFFSEYKTNTVSFENPLGKLGVQEFCVHDLRRTFSTIAADNRVSGDVIDLGLNHLKRKDRRPYDHSTRPLERKEMYQVMADIVLPLTHLKELLEAA